MGDELTAWVSFEEMKKGGWCMIKGNPCKVTDITAKVKGTGASANERVVITGTHFLTGKQSTDTINLTNAHDGLEVPVTSKKKYALLDVDTDSGFLSLLTDEGETKEDASLSKKEDDSGEQVWDDVGKRRFWPHSLHAMTLGACTTAYAGRRAPATVAPRRAAE